MIMLAILHSLIIVNLTEQNQSRHRRLFYCLKEKRAAISIDPTLPIQYTLLRIMYIMLNNNNWLFINNSKLNLLSAY